MARTHAKLAPSSAHRWMLCTASVRAIAAVGKRPAGPYAEEGSLAHAFAEWFLKERDAATDYIGFALDLADYATPQLLTREMAEGVQAYLDVCNDLIDAAGPVGEWIVERLVHVPTIHHGLIFGTSDFGLYNPATRTLHVVDFKYGAGVAVEAYRSKQMLLYALGLAFSMGWWPRYVEVTIVQPRAYHPVGTIRTYTLPWLECLFFAVEVDQAVERVEAGGDYVPGQQCRWCEAAWSCPGLRSAVMRVVEPNLALDGKLYPENLPKPSDMNDNELNDALSVAAMLSVWVNEVKREAQYRLMSGIPVPGRKLVERQAKRKYDPAISEKRVAAALVALGVPSDDVMRKKLITITDAEERILKGKRGDARKEAELAFAKLTVRESSGYEVVEADDERPAVDLFASMSTGVTLDLG